MPEPALKPPLTIRMHAHDNVAIVANDGGLAAGTALVPAASARPGWRWISRIG